MHGVLVVEVGFTMIVDSDGSRLMTHLALWLAMILIFLLKINKLAMPTILTIYAFYTSCIFEV